MLGVLVVSVLFVLPHLGAKRLPFWLSWSFRATLAIVALDIAVTFLVGAAATSLSTKGGWHPTELPYINSLAPTLLANLSIRRRGANNNAGDALAFRAAAWWHTVLQGQVEESVQNWAWDKTRVPVHELADLCARFDVDTTHVGAVAVRAEALAELAKKLGSPVPAETIAAESMLRNALASTVINNQRRQPK